MAKGTRTDPDEISPSNSTSCFVQTGNQRSSTQFQNSCNIVLLGRIKLQAMCTSFDEVAIQVNNRHFSRCYYYWGFVYLYAHRLLWLDYSRSSIGFSTWPSAWLWCWTYTDQNHVQIYHVCLVQLKSKTKNHSRNVTMSAIQTAVNISLVLIYIPNGVMTAITPSFRRPCAEI